jgi:hypothetical protein
MVTVLGMVTVCVSEGWSRSLLEGTVVVTLMKLLKTPLLVTFSYQDSVRNNHADSSFIRSVTAGETHWTAVRRTGG